jgi:hypothetical protein
LRRKLQGDEPIRRPVEQLETHHLASGWGPSRARVDFFLILKRVEI